MEPRVLSTDAKGTGEPIVLVPGGLSGWISWIPHAERLSDRHNAVRVQPIHNELGSAGQPGDPSYTVETERESLRLTLDALAIETAHLAGWSGGARALIEFALEYPERSRTLTLVEPAAHWILEQMGEELPDVAAVNEFVSSVAGKNVGEDELARFLELAGFVASADQAPSHPMWERSLPHRNALSWQSQLGTSRRTVEELRTIDVPVLLVKGTVTADWLKRVVDALAKELPSADVLELEGSHACHIESIDEFMPALERHIARAT